MKDIGLVKKLSYDPKSDPIGRGQDGTIVFNGLFQKKILGGKMSVAVKKIVSNKKTAQSVQKEIEVMEKACSKRSHPNILRYICTKRTDDFLFIVTELCSGTLDDYFNGRYHGPKFISEKEILFQATQGLAYLHSLKIIHRDIKPTNILISLLKGNGGEPQIKLADFGLSKILRVDQEDYTNSNPSNPSGTREWIAPEAHDPKRCGYKEDVWALGLIIGFTLSGGKHPFGEDLDERSSRIKKKEPMILVQQDLKEPYSDDAEAFELIQTMLVIEPENRPKIEDVKNNLFFLKEASNTTRDLNDQNSQQMEIEVFNMVTLEPIDGQARGIVKEELKDKFFITNQIETEVNTLQDLKEPYSVNPEAFKLTPSMLTIDPNQRPKIVDIESSTFFLMDPSSSQPNTHKGIEKHHPPHNRQQIVDADIHQHSSSEHHQMDLEERPQQLIQDVYHHTHSMEGFKDLACLSVGHTFETKRASLRIVSYLKPHVLKKKTYSNVYLETCVYLHSTRIGPSVEKKADRHPSFRMKNNQKPLVKRFKVMDLKRLRPNLPQLEFKLTQPKVDVKLLKKLMDAFKHHSASFTNQFIDQERATGGIGKLKTTTPRLRHHHLYKKSVYDKDTRLSNDILSDGLNLSFELSSNEEMQLFIGRYSNNLPSSSSVVIKIESEGEKEMWKITYDGNRMLGKGAYGKVFEGKLINRKTRTLKKVAVKRHEMLRVDMSRTLVELHLDHPNVVKLLAYQDVDDIFRLCCLELCNASLDKAFLPDSDSKKYRGQLPNEIDFMLQLSLGLDYIHSKNLVHRDIHPGNILINSSGRQVLIKLSDFLLSKETKNGKFVLMSNQDDQGTMYFWSPEILSFYETSRLSKKTNDENIPRTTHLTNKIDIFACGIVFFKFLTKGLHPFGTEAKEIMMNLRQSQPNNLSTILSSTSRFEFSVIQKMLEKKEEDRPNMRELIPLLTSFQLYRMKKGAFQQIKQRNQELFSLCSHPNPSAQQQLNKIVQILAEDSIGLLNIVDDNGNSPLLILCQSNQSTSLLPCIKVMVSKNHNEIPKSIMGSTNSATTELDINYQDRNGFNALHYVCMKYDGVNLIEIIELLVDRGIDVNKTEHRLDRNALQLLIENNRNDERDLFKIVQLFLNKGIDLVHKDANGWTALHYLCRYHNRYTLVDLVRLLIHKGVDIDAKDGNGENAFDFVRRFYTLANNRSDVFRLLVRNENVPDGLCNRKTPILNRKNNGHFKYKNSHDYGHLRTGLVVPL